MSVPFDIYNPPAAPVLMRPPQPEPIRWSARDMLVLVLFAFPVYLATVWAWAVDNVVGLWVTIAGGFMILESWFSALTFLYRHPNARGLTGVRRWMVFFTALSPWLITLGFGVVLMMILFQISDSNVFAPR